jgi:ubiquinone/menaquinone biosynthesis C-methylase UbiE
MHTTEDRSKRYYDEFSATYERERHHGYHLLLDDLEVETVGRWARPGDLLLEAGCGTGLILKRLAALTGRAVGIDLSAGMLALARDRQLPVTRATVTALPFPDGTFDGVVSFKVLAHVPEIAHALVELARVTRPGGRLVLEFYNRRSLRGLVKRLKPPTRIGATFSDEDVYTRLDTLEELRRSLPADLELEAVRGARVLTVVARLHDLPLVGPLLGAVERLAADAPLLRALGGFLILTLRKSPMPRP